MKIKKKDRKKILFIAVGSLSILLIFFITTVPLAIIHVGDDGGIVYTSVPDTPTLNTIPSQNTDGSITLSWSNPGSLYGFRIYRSVGVNSPFTLLKSVSSTTTSYTFTEVDGRYLYKIHAYNNIGNSQYSNTVYTIVLIPIVLPSTPTLSQISSPNIDGDITLSWSNPANTLGFNIFRSVNGGSYNFFKTLTSTSWSFSETDGSYSYKVKAYNNNGDSGYSNIVSVIVDIPVIPNAPILDAISPSIDIDGDINLFWNSPANTISFEIHRSKNGGTFDLIKTTISTWHTDAGLVDGTYRYKIIAKNLDGDSDYSNIRSVTVDIPVIPSAPILNPISPSTDIDGSITLSWSNSIYATSYKVYRSQDNRVFEPIKTVTTTTYVDTISVNGLYKYKIIAKNLDGDSSYSNTRSVSVDIPVILNAPILDAISPVINTDGNIDLSWNKPENTISFEIHRSKNGGTFDLIKTTTFTRHTDIGLVDGTYRYKIIARNLDGISDYSNIVSVTVDIPITADLIPVPTLEINPVYLLVGGLGLSIILFLVYKNSKKSKRSKKHKRK